jgi:glycosyltransferase involved in cell wall biosynthesis
MSGLRGSWAIQPRRFCSRTASILSKHFNLNAKVVIAGTFNFPGGSASASRVRNLALGLVEAGTSVHVISMVPPSPAVFDEACSCQWNYHGITYEFASPCCALRTATGPFAPVRQFARKLVWLRRLYASAKPAYRSLERMILSGRCDLFIGYGRMLSLLRPLLRACQRHRIVGIIDVVEIPGSTTGFGGCLSPLWWEEKLGCAYFAKHCEGLTAITTTLQEYYEKRGAQKVLVLPSLAERRDFHAPPIHDSNQPFTLAYVGALSDRDNPELMFAVMRELIATGNNVRLKVVGRYQAHAAGRRWLERCRCEPALHSSVEFVGELSDEELRESMNKADALILMRRNAYSEWASFPTRLVEYLDFGLPVFASAVGDIACYLVHNSHAILLSGEDPRTIAESICSVIASPDRGRDLGLQGRLRGEGCFDRAVHARRLLQFAAELRTESVIAQ